MVTTSHAENVRKEISDYCRKGLGTLHATAQRVTGSEHEVGDIVQETLLRALQSPHTYDAQKYGGDIGKWLGGMARKESIKYLRKGKNTQRRDLEQIEEPATTTNEVLLLLLLCYIFVLFLFHVPLDNVLFFSWTFPTMPP